MQPSCIHFYALLILVISMLSVPIHFCIISSRAIDLTVWVPLNFCFEATGTLCTSESSVLYIGLACVATTSTPVPHIDIVGLIWLLCVYPWGVLPSAWFSQNLGFLFEKRDEIFLGWISPTVLHVLFLSDSDSSKWVMAESVPRKSYSIAAHLVPTPSTISPQNLLLLLSSDVSYTSQSRRWWARNLTYQHV